MCAQPRSSAAFAVRSPAALASLGDLISTLDSPTRKRGQGYLREGRVLRAVAEENDMIAAEVEGQEIYGVTLSHHRGEWSLLCTCPMESYCKHTVATGLAWIASGGTDIGPENNNPSKYFLSRDQGFPRKKPSVAPSNPTPPSAQPSKKNKKSSFRDQWSPFLAEKLGRPLTADEGARLGHLAALFTEFQQSHRELYARSLRHYGFPEIVPPNASTWEPLFRGWWTFDSAPADPWALWQYLAYSLEQRGRLVPEIFRPLTDTSAVHAALDALLARQQLDEWSRALAPSMSPAFASDTPLFEPGSSLRARLDAEGQLFVELRSAPDKPWKPPSQKWANALAQASAAEFESLPPAEGALALALTLVHRHGYFAGTLKQSLPPQTIAAVLASRAAHPAVVLPDGRPLTIEAEPLTAEAILSATARDRLEIHLVTPAGLPVPNARLLATQPVPLYLHEDRVWRGPLPFPATPLPTAAIGDAQIMSRLRARGVRLPQSLSAKFRRIILRPLLKLSLTEPRDAWGGAQLHAQLFARSDDPACTQECRGPTGWTWAKASAPPPRRPDDPLFDFDLTAAEAVRERFAAFRLGWADWTGAWARDVTKNFPEEFIAWQATLPPGLDIDASPELAGFFAAPLRATVDFSALPADASHDWFDLTVALRVEDTTLTAAEIALLLKARGKWVRLPKGGWRRLELAGTDAGGPAAAALDRLGLSPADVFASGQPATHRLHALQLAGEAASLESRDAELASALRARAARLATLPPPPLPAGLTATLRPYQQEGFHFLAHLATQGFGGVLADDMGLGKTVQTLAWLLHLAALPATVVPAPKRAKAAKSATADQPFRALVVCPKSVVHGWLAETARFAPSLTVTAFTPALASSEISNLKSQILLANYTQLRLHATWFQSGTWDAVVLDEGQFIKNPASQMAVAARALPSRHRLILTGTPVENRLTDLWSLFAFAQPGLLGAQAAFRRQYDEKDPAALSRLHRRVRHFLLRRTKAQAAPDLPARTEDDLVVELEPAQRKLYDAELKRARAQLLGVETNRALDAVRFNVLASLLRLRQICCHPALVDPAHADLPSAKLDALLERLEELHEEGHQVLVFSQFVEMLELIRTRLAASGIGHLLLTGQTENRAELVQEFQRDRTKTVFLLSLKAAGFGLNLTAASYAILYDPWWNPAVEAQAIDRTHRIGQTRPVTAYRLLAANTVEQKIRALQQEKAALAAAVVQEESLATVLDLASLRRILE